MVIKFREDALLLPHDRCCLLHIGFGKLSKFVMGDIHGHAPAVLNHNCGGKLQFDFVHAELVPSDSTLGLPSLI
jgi:hypothetical protein